MLFYSQLAYSYNVRFRFMLQGFPIFMSVFALLFRCVLRICFNSSFLCSVAILVDFQNRCEGLISLKCAVVMKGW